MEYQSNSLYSKINQLTSQVKSEISKIDVFRNKQIFEYRKVLIGKSTLVSSDPIGKEFDFVIPRDPNQKWQNQRNKDDILLVAKVIYKQSIRGLDLDIEQEMFHFHSIRALRKMLIIVNTIDEGKSIIGHFLKNYEVSLNYPPYLSEKVNLDTCPVCGTSPSKLEPWFYNEETEELLPILDHLNDNYFEI